MTLKPKVENKEDVLRVVKVRVAQWSRTRMLHSTQNLKVSSTGEQ